MTSPTILIVENHTLLRNSLRDWLATTFEQCHIIEASNGLEAIEKVQEQSPQIIIMDIALPKLDRLKAGQRIKTLAPDTRIVILTIYGDNLHRAKAMTTGVSAYVSKSELESKLVPTLQTLLAE